MAAQGESYVATAGHLLGSVVSSVGGKVGDALRLTGLRREAGITYKVRGDCDLNGTELPVADRREFVRELVAELRRRNKTVELGGSLSEGKFSVWLTVDAADPVAATETAYKLLDSAARDAGRARGRDNVALSGVEALQLTAR